jgi:hypothetical protein
VRLHTGSFVTALLTATLAVSGCTASDKPAPCSEQSKPPACVPSGVSTRQLPAPDAKPDTTTDIVIRDTSFRRIIGVANQFMGSQVPAHFIAKDAQAPCKLLDESFIVRGSEDMMVFCGEGYIAMPQGVTVSQRWTSKPDIGLWYEVALEVVQAQSSYDDILRASCTAAYAISFKLDYKRAVDGEQLLKYMASAEYGADAIDAVRKGLDAAEAKKSPTTSCTSA